MNFNLKGDLEVNYTYGPYYALLRVT